MKSFFEIRDLDDFESHNLWHAFLAFVFGTLLLTIVIIIGCYVLILIGSFVLWQAPVLLTWFGVRVTIIISAVLAAWFAFDVYHGNV